MVAFAENKIPKGGSGYNADAETQNYYVRNRYYAAHLGRWLTRDPIGYQGGVNLYEYVQSSPVANVDAEGMWWPNITPNVVVNQNGIQGIHEFNAAVARLGSLSRSPGETSQTCIQKAFADAHAAVRNASEVLDSAIEAEAYALYQEGVINNLQNSEVSALHTVYASIAIPASAIAAAGAESVLFSEVARPVSTGLVIAGRATALYFSAANAMSAGGAALPPQYRPEMALYEAMLNRISAALEKAVARCHCGGGG